MADEAKDAFLDRLWRAYTALMEREKGKVSQEAIAKAITAYGAPTRQDQLSRWLRWVGRPNFEEVGAVARSLGVRRDWLAFGEGQMIDSGGQNSKAPPVKLTPKGTLAGRKKREA